MLVVRDNTIKALGQSLKLTKQRCNDILFESRQRKYTLTEIRLENDKLQEALKQHQDYNCIMILIGRRTIQ